MLDDATVIARVLGGDTPMFELIMRRYNQRLFRAARAILRDDAEAEDVTQAAYVRAYEHLREFEGRAAFSTWLLRIAVNEALARRRRRLRDAPAGAHTDEETFAMEEEGTSTMPAWSDDPEQRAAARELRPFLEAAIDALPTPFRAVFVLRAVEELSVAETAACLTIPEETVKTRLFRARAALQKLLQDRLDAAAHDAFTFGNARCDRTVDAVLARIGAPARGPNTPSASASS